MRGRVTACLLVAGALALTGCISADVAAPLEDQNLPLPDLLPSADPLWHNPQTFPHPAYNFPTLTNPLNVTDDQLPNKFYKPIAPKELPTHIEGFELVAEAGKDVPSGAGMTVFGSLAIVPGFGAPTSIVDISDPAKPVVLGTFDESTRGTDVIAFPNGTLIAVFATDAGVIPIYDITDPTMPERIGEIDPPTGVHKVNVVPGTPILYNANSAGGAKNGLIGPEAYDPSQAAGQTEIYDLSNPWAPVLVQEFKNGYGCHHIYFWNNPTESKYRATCAGIEYTQIWDTTDPLNPSVIVSVPVHHGVTALPSTSIPLEAFSHFAILNYEGNVLIVGDENGGGSFPPGCTVGAETPVRRASGPVGALWFYDVSDETNPQLLGWFSPMHQTDNPTRSCTAHHGRLVPDPEGRDLLAMAFYGAGVVLVDFTDPMSPRQLDQFNPGTDTWEAQYYNGYVFTGDLARGMDVLGFR